MARTFLQWQRLLEQAAVREAVCQQQVALTATQAGTIRQGISARHELLTGLKAAQTDEQVAHEAANRQRYRTSLLEDIARLANDLRAVEKQLAEHRERLVAASQQVRMLERLVERLKGEAAHRELGAEQQLIDDRAMPRL